jgi:hypothetical protein
MALKEVGYNEIVEKIKYSIEYNIIDIPKPIPIHVVARTQSPDA